METIRELTENLAALLRRENEALAEFLIALADFDRRRAWVELGHSSLFYFLTRELRLSNAAAQYRKVAAEFIQEIPAIVEPLRRGELCLTSIIEAAKVVTADNWEEVLPRFYRLSRREAMEVVAELQPHPAPPVRTVVTPVRSGPVSTRDALEPQELAFQNACDPRVLTPTGASSAHTSLLVTSPGEVEGSIPGRNARSVTPVQALEVIPLTAEQSRMHLTVSREFLRKLEAARDAMSHARPDATTAELLEAGLDLLLAQAAKRNGLVDRPQKKPRPSRRDHIPAHVRREVWKRDGGKCQWRLDSGGICGATRHLELDHIHPRSMGGASTADNLRVACRFHNGLAARLALGDDLMDRYMAGPAGTGARRREGRPRASEAAATSPPRTPRGGAPSPVPGPEAIDCAGPA